MDRDTRRLIHDKGSRIKSVTSPPKASEGQDGDMRISKGSLYVKDGHKWYEFLPKPQFKIDKILSGDNTADPQIELKYSSNNTLGKDYRTLAEKINKIIDLLRLNVK